MDARLMRAAGALLFSLAPCQIAWGAKLVNVRMWPAAEYTRVTIETDEPLKYKHFFVRSAKPLRLVIDIEGLALTERIKKLIAAVNLMILIFNRCASVSTSRALCVWLWISKRT